MQYKSVGERDVTPQMIRAGYEVIALFDRKDGDAEETAVAVYLAMEAARQSGSEKS